MNLYFKFFLLILKRIFIKQPLNMSQTCISNFRVGLLDLDLNFHMNNGRFLTVMDLGRFDLLMRTGFFMKLFTNGYYPVVLSESIVFRKSLNLWNKYSIHTRINSFDAKFFYMTQEFHYAGKIVASANVRACFKKRGRQGIVTPKELYDFMDVEFKPLPLSEVAQKQIELDNALMPRKPQ